MKTKSWLVAPLVAMLLFGTTFVTDYAKELDQTGTINTMMENVAPAVYCFDCRSQINLCNNLDLQMEIARIYCQAFGNTFGDCDLFDRLFFLVGQCWNSVDLNCNYPDI